MKNSGVLRIGFKLLVNDKGKFSALLIGITFAVFLMMQMTAMFAGILNRAYSTVTNIGASMWIMDPGVNTATSPIPLPNYLEDAVRSMDGVSYAVPLFVGGAMVKLTDGTYQSVNVVGLDDDSLFGRPELEQGNIQDIYADNAFMVVDDAEFKKLREPEDRYHVRTQRSPRYDCGHRQGRFKWTERRANALYDLQPRDPIHSADAVHAVLCAGPAEKRRRRGGYQAEVAKLGYVAFTKDEFNSGIADYYIYKTGVGTNILLMTIISFIVGLAISGQTFYTFIIENLEKFGALKAIGAKGRKLVYMILFMAALTSLTGYGLGILLVTVVISGARSLSPYYAATITYWNLGLAFGMVLLIAAISGYIGVRKVLKIEPFDIFRG
jgi:putative ABC transport system permease protein